MSFIHLHTHSDYSPQDGAQSCKQIAKRAAELGMNSVALTDHGRAGGLLTLKKECEKAGIKPIYGYEAYIAPKERQLREKLDDHKKTSYHLCLLAKNEVGLKNIFRLTSIGWIEGYYYKPRIDMEVLRELSEGIICLSGCGSGRPAQMILEDRWDEAVENIKELKDIFGEDLYLEVQNHGLDWQQDLKKKLFKLGEVCGVPMVATQDSHYQKREDSEMHGAICRLAAGDLQFDSDQSYFKSEEEMKKMFAEDEWHAITRTQEIADKCNCEWKYGDTIWPIFPIEGGKTPTALLEENAREGFKKLFGEGTDEYRDRLDYELGIIDKMGFPTYFLVVADFINWSKANDIPVGPGRGSGAGSLVCYCIGITNVDPIKYGLYFERFLNPARISLPDIDVDFCPEGRKTVLQYVYNKYGPEKCAQIGTYAAFKPRGSLRAFARVLGHPPKVGDELSAVVPPDVSGKTIKMDDVIDEKTGMTLIDALRKMPNQDVVKMAYEAEGLVQQQGVHAAGVVISNEELAAQVPLSTGKNHEVITQLDMHEVEELGLVKYDFLGLKNLTVIKNTIKHVKKYRDIDIDIDAIDEFDMQVFTDVFQKGRLDGIFQFETSSGFRDLCIQIKPRSIEDLSAITALFRPGPLTAKDETGKRTLVQKYVAGRNGEKVTYLFPELEPILQDTYGVMVYQEQIMRICTDCAGYSLAEADNMRKIIGKKLPEKMALEKEKLVSGCVSNGIPKDKAEKLFKDIEGFAAYSFNKAHSVAYSIISYQTAWLKTHYKEEFYCALLNNSLKDQGDMVKYISASKDDEIPLMTPDVNLSEPLFSLSEGTIVFGFAGVKGIGPKAAASMVDLRPEEGFKSIEHMVGLKVNKGAVKALGKCGALEEINEFSRRQMTDHFDELFTYYQKKFRYENRVAEIEKNAKEIEAWNANPIGKKPKKKPKINEKHIPVMPEIGEADDLTKKERLHLERQTVGFYLTGHPMDDFPNLSRMSKCSISDLKNIKPEDTEIKDGDKISIPVVVSSITQKRTKTGNNMGILVIEDKTGRMEATLFARQWNKLKDILELDRVTILNARVNIILSDNEESPPIVRLVVNSAKLVDEDSASVVMSPVEAKMADGTVVTFTPSEEQNYSKWQQAVAFVNNMQRTTDYGMD